MRCIHCSVDSKKKERLDGCCSGCKHKFAFDPTNGDRITDVGFKNALDRLSGGGRLRWTEQQLYYEICRVTKTASAGAWSIGGLVVSLPAFAVGATFGLVALGAAIVHAVVRLASPTARATDRLTPAGVGSLLERWRIVHGEPVGLLPRPQQEYSYRTAPVEPDVGDYSFDRAVICDRAETVDILLGNRFHFENNCAVLSADGYPKRAFDTVRAMLRRNPKIAVFALHDCTPDGCRLATKLRNDERWFRGLGTVTDVGLRPVHARPFQRLLLRGAGPVTPGGGIDPAEAAWLSRSSLELAAIRPEQIVKRLFKAISHHDARVDDIRKARSSSGTGTDGGVYIGGTGGDGSVHDDATDDVSVDTTSFSADADASDGGGDSFG